MRDIALTLVIAGLLPVCVMRPWIGILVWYWFGMMNPHRLTFGFAYDMPFGMMIGGAILLGILITRDRKSIPWSRETVLMLLLFGYYTLTTLFAWAPAEAWAQWDKVMKIVLMTFVASMLIYGRDRIRALLLVLALSIGYYGIKGGVFTLMTGGVHQVQGPDGSFIAGNTYLGLALVMVIPLLTFLAREEKGKWMRRALYAALGLCILSAVFTYSRGALIGLAGSLPLLFLRAKKKVLLILVLVPLAFFAKDLIPEKLYKRAESIETYEQDPSSMQRIRSWQAAFNVATESPLLGAGFEFESYPDKSRWFSYVDPELRVVYGGSTHSAHSIYFQVLGQHGIVALAMFVCMLLFTLSKLGSLKRKASGDPEAQWIANYASAIQIALIGYMLAGTFLSLAYFDLMYIYVALSAILQRELQVARGGTRLAERGPAGAWRVQPGAPLADGHAGASGASRRA